MGILVVPDSPAKCADLLYETRKDRLTKQKDVDKLKEFETQLTQYLLNALPEDGASGIAGQVARVSLVQKQEPTVVDKDVLRDHILATGEWELLQGRLSAAAVKERWQDGETIPGIGVFLVTTLSVSKV